MKSTAKNTAKGFTLIEIIMTFVLGGILATMIMPYFMSGATEAQVPMARLQNSSVLNEAMSLIVADYNALPLKDSTNLTALMNRVNAFCSNYTLTNATASCASLITASARNNVTVGNLTNFTSASGTSVTQNTVVATVTSNNTTESLTNVFFITQ